MTGKTFVRHHVTEPDVLQYRNGSSEGYLQQELILLSDVLQLRVVTELLVYVVGDLTKHTGNTRRGLKPCRKQFLSETNKSRDRLYGTKDGATPPILLSQLIGVRNLLVLARSPHDAVVNSITKTLLLIVPILLKLPSVVEHLHIDIVPEVVWKPIIPLLKIFFGYVLSAAYILIRLDEATGIVFITAHID